MELFRKDVDPRCAYCASGKPMGGGEVGCTRRGIVKEYFHCKKFNYDPLRRVPPKPPTLGKNYSENDFAI
ncbi:hypothetical protein FACS1894217_09820 [Clostridia bacterium]|nr:hypothetical protein FACS1894217_09820 [Clostridia bacterium]